MAEALELGRRALALRRAMLPDATETEIVEAFRRIRAFGRRPSRVTGSDDAR